MIRRSFMLGTAGLMLLPARGFAADIGSGRYVVNGKEAKLAFVSAWAGGPSPTLQVIGILLTESDHSASRFQSTEAAYGKFGAALSIMLNRADLQMLGATVVNHPGHKQLNAGVLSKDIQSEGVTSTADRIEGRFFTPKPATKNGDDVVEFDVKVATSVVLKHDTSAPGRARAPISAPRPWSI